MEEILNSDALVGIAALVAGFIMAKLGDLLGALAEKIKKSENKLDDVLLPYIERMEKALEKDAE